MKHADEVFRMFMGDFKNEFKKKYDIDYDDFEGVNSLIKASKNFVTIEEAAKILNVSVSTLRKLADTGKVECFKTVGGHRKFSLWGLRKMCTKSIADNFIEKYGEKYIIRDYDYLPEKVSILYERGWVDSRMIQAFEEGVFHWFDNIDDCISLSAELRTKYIKTCNRTFEEERERLKSCINSE